MSYELGCLLGGRYKIYHSCNGGFGEIIFCEDIRNNRFYALKTIQQRHFKDLEVRRAFRSEVEIWVTLHSHQNIVRCYGLETYGNKQFIVLDWVYSTSRFNSDLRSYVRENQITTKQAIQWIIDACWGLVYAQNKHPGLVHGDIKPANLLLFGGHPTYAKITDFGLARFRRANEKEQAVIAGSPLYMAPELWLGAGVDQRTDIYALGCVLFELLAGSPPFTGSTLDECRRMHLSASVENFRLNNTNAELRNIAMRCLEKDKAHRFQRVDELLLALVETHGQLFDEPPLLAPAKTPDEHLPILDEISLTMLPITTLLIDGTNKESLEPSPVVQLKKLWTEFSTFLGLHDLEKARRIAHDMLSKLPWAAESYRCLGDLCAAEGDPDEAISQFTKALGIDPDFAAAYDGRAKAKWELGNHAEAMQDITKAVENAPSEASPLVTRGFWLAQLGRFPEALEDLNSAIDIDAAAPVALTNRAYVYASLEEYEKALGDYDSAVSIDANYAPGYLGRSGMNVALGKFELAINDCAKVIELGHRRGEAYYQMGIAYLQLGKNIKAAESLKKSALMGCNLAIEPLQALLNTNE